MFPSLFFFIIRESKKVNCQIKEVFMLREWIAAEMPEEEELKTDLEAAREKMVQQL